METSLIKIIYCNNTNANSKEHIKEQTNCCYIKCPFKRVYACTLASTMLYTHYLSQSDSLITDSSTELELMSVSYVVSSKYLTSLPQNYSFHQSYFINLLFFYFFI